ncbi:hypothetical protein [Clostridium sp. DL1XJH146]
MRLLDGSLACFYDENFRIIIAIMIKIIEIKLEILMIKFFSVLLKDNKKSIIKSRSKGKPGFNLNFIN